MSTVKYSAVVLGAGPGGYPCGIRLGQLGVKTLVIEREYWGGVCLNVGCIPSKALITAGKRVEEIAHADVMGIEVPGKPVVHMDKLQAWKQSVVNKLTGGVRTLLKANKVDMMVGNAEFTGPRALSVTTAEGVVTVEADNVVIAVGSRPIEIPGFSFKDRRVLDSTKALALDEIPRRLAVIGGGYIGLEMGMMYAKLGSEVTVVEAADQVLPGFDPDVVKLIERKLKKDKVKVFTRSQALGWEEGDGGATLRYRAPDGEKTVDVDYILVTVGRRPNTDTCKLEATGVAMEGRFIQTDSQLKTSVPGVFAIGDCTTGLMLAHKASHDGEVAAEVIGGHNAHNVAKTVPAVVFTDPEIATAGLMEHEARAKGFEVKVGKVPFAAIGRALTTGDTDGFIKVIVDKKNDRVLGVTICGPHASDLISEAALAVEMDCEALDIGLTIHPHPTLGEGVMEAAKAAIGQAIHVVNG
ncbi:MAG: dihydrolipoyl dehydrogenase [Deltaproteobacteria bacterium]|nr:dihydrolipoyl dehydrogenase [Deltaproteobacteria bacterium]